MKTQRERLLNNARLASGSVQLALGWFQKDPSISLRYLKQALKHATRAAEIARRLQLKRAVTSK